MRWKADGWLIEQLIAKGVTEDTLPQLARWVLDEPPTDEVMAFYLTAFYRLSTSRQVGMSIGPIPWLAVADYADRMRLDYVNRELFEVVIYAMDRAWIDWTEERRAAEAKANAKPLPKPGR